MGWYYVITQEIRESFEGKEADVFAVINGFSQEGQGCFYGSLSLLSQFCGIKSKTTTQRILKSLVAKGAIVKTDELHNGVKFCTYKVNKNWYGISKIDMGGVSEIDTNNKEDINVNTLSIKGSGRFQKPSLDDIREYCISRSNKVDPEQFYNFYESKGWMVGKTPMKDWRAAIRTWEKRETGSPARKQESVLEHNLKVMDQMYGTSLHAQTYGGQTHGK
jgi:hypothetical protein